jgi:hypothetical protein
MAIVIRKHDGYDGNGFADAIFLDKIGLGRFL